jgi:hypothetical protein
MVARPPMNYGRYGDLAKWPVIGPWSAALGQVIDIFATPCVVKPEIWVNAFWYSLPRLLTIFTTPFLLAWKWEQLTKRNHQGTKSRLSMIKDFGPKAPVPEGPAWAVFEVATDLALKLEWYFFIADRTAEFAVNWTSLAYEWSGCQFPGELHAQAWRAEPGFAGIGFGDTPLLADRYDPGNNLQVFPNGVQLRAGEVGVFTFSVTTSQATGFPEGLQDNNPNFYILNNATGEVVGNTVVNTLDPNTNGTAQVSVIDGAQPNLTTIGVYYHSAGVFIVDTFTWTFYGHTTGTRGLFYPK